MRNILFMHKSHSLQNLFHVTLNILNWDTTAKFTQLYVASLSFAQQLNSLFGVLDHLFEIFITELKYKVLCRFSIITS